MKTPFYLTLFWLTLATNGWATTYYFDSSANSVRLNSSSGSFTSSVESVSYTVVPVSGGVDEFRFEGDLIFESNDFVYFRGNAPIRVVVNGDVVIPSGMFLSASASGQTPGAGGGNGGETTTGGAGGRGGFGGAGGSGGAGGAGGAPFFGTGTGGKPGTAGSSALTGSSGPQSGLLGGTANGTSGVNNPNSRGDGGLLGFPGSAANIRGTGGSAGSAGVYPVGRGGNGGPAATPGFNSGGNGFSGGDGGDAFPGAGPFGTAFTLAAGGGGGSGAAGSGGGGGYGGGGGGGGGGGAGGGGYIGATGESGQRGGGGGSGGQGGDGQRGGSGGRGGAGAGAFEFVVYGTLSINGLVYAIGGTPEAGRSPTGSIDLGNSGGSVTAPSGGTLNNGGTGGAGGTGGTGGQGGDGGSGGGGGGGTIILRSNVVTGSYGGSAVGGGSGSVKASDGRLLVETRFADHVLPSIAGTEFETVGGLTRPNALFAPTIGIDIFDDAGSLDGNDSNALGFDFDSTTNTQTGTTSAWQVLYGSVIARELVNEPLRFLASENEIVAVTNASKAKRNYNGDDEAAGAKRGSGLVFYRISLKRTETSGVTGISSFDFGSEKIFFGVLDAGSDAVGIEARNTPGTALPAGPRATAALTLNDDEEYDLIGVIDFNNNVLGLFVDPNDSDYWDVGNGNNSADVTLAYTGTNWSTGVAISSDGEAEWDDLQVGFSPLAVGLASTADGRILDGLSSPVIGNLKDGPDVFGVSTTLTANQFMEDIPREDDDLAIVLVSGPFGNLPRIEGHNWLYYANVSGARLPIPSLGLGRVANLYPRQIQRSGRSYHRIGQSSTAQPALGFLEANEVFVALVPTDGSVSPFTIAGYELDQNKVEGLGVGFRLKATQTLVTSAIALPDDGAIYKDSQGRPRQPFIIVPGVNDSNPDDQIAIFGPDGYFEWYEGRILLVRRPVTGAEIRWYTQGPDGDPSNDTFVSRFATTRWPNEAEGLQIHLNRIADGEIHPPVDLVAPDPLPEGVAAWTFERILYQDASLGGPQDGAKIVAAQGDAQRQFRVDGVGQDSQNGSDIGVGYSTLLFKQGGNPVVRVVRTIRWNDRFDEQSPSALKVGEEFNEEDFGHTDPDNAGWVVNVDGSVFDAVGENAAYQRSTRTGQIIPVNTGGANTVITYTRDAFGIDWPTSAVAVTTQWPDDSEVNEIVLSSGLGSQGQKNGVDQIDLDSVADLMVYRQPDPNLAGFNPNEEHAFIDQSRVFALRNDLNELPDPDLSQPYVLAKYNISLTPNETKVWKIRPYKVLTVSNDYPNFLRFPATVGTPVRPPDPLGLRVGSCISNETAIQEGDAGFRDARGGLWARRDGEIRAQWYYPLDRTLFWWDDALAGEPMADGCVPWLDRITAEVNGGVGTRVGEPVLTFYDAAWPASAKELLLGDTLTDGSGSFGGTGDIPNLLTAVDVAITYDDSNPEGAEPTKASAVIFNGLQAEHQPIGNPLANPPAAQIQGTELVVGDSRFAVSIAGANEGYGNNRYLFDSLTRPLKMRLVWDDTEKRLEFVGRFPTIPPSLVGLYFPNVMSALERDFLKEFDNDAVLGGAAQSDDWDAAIDALFAKSRNPNQLDLDIDGNPDTTVLRGFTKDVDDKIIFEPTIGGDNVMPVNLGPDATFVRSDSDGRKFNYLTLITGNSPTETPSMFVLKIVQEAASGKAVVIEEENVFSEEITMRSALDFGGQVADKEFEWLIKVNEEGNPAPIDPNASRDSLINDGWQVLSSGFGQNFARITPVPNPLQTLRSYDAIYRWRGPEAIFGQRTEGNRQGYSQWVGQGPPANDPLFVPGWITRVTQAINAVDPRVTDFRKDAPQTYVNLIGQAGKRFQAAVSLTQDAVGSAGLIEFYETVVRRGAKLSIDGSPPANDPGVNNELLKATSKIADLWMLLGNEANSDALDPTVGIGGEAGLESFASSIFSFEGVQGVNSLLAEELALLRGVDDRNLTSDTFNKLIWNFSGSTTGSQAAYVSNYAISDGVNLNDGSSDGTINESDAQSLYPQGHGDARGDYLSAVKAYLRLLRDNEFVWQRRSDSVQIGTSRVEVDYLDERKFAQAASALANTDLQVVDLTYRERYTADPAGQWQGYKDTRQVQGTNRSRAWGLDEWGRRSVQGAYLNWITANAILPEKDLNPEATPLSRIDRTTVDGLAEIVESARRIQERIDSADAGLNPLGLASNATPFDIDAQRATDPVQARRKTHFEQIYERAVKAALNAKAMFDQANDLTNRLREGFLDEVAYTSEVYDVEQDYKAQLIEIFGYPHSGNIGAGQVYPQGYSGPDLYFWRYIDVAAVTGETVPGPTVSVRKLVDGFVQGAQLPGTGGSADDLESVVGHYFGDLTLLDNGTRIGLTDQQNLQDSLEVVYPLRPESTYPFVKPADWGSRFAPGKLQFALIDAVRLEAAYETAVAEANLLIAEIEDELQLLEANFDLEAKEIEVRGGLIAGQTALSASIIAAKAAISLSGETKEGITIIAAAAADALPTAAGTSVDVGAAGRAAIYATGIGAATAATAAEVAAQGVVAGLEATKELATLGGDFEILKANYRFDIQQRLKNIEQLMRRESLARLQVFTSQQELAAAYGRVDELFADGQRVLDFRATYRRGVSGNVSLARYRDIGFRNFRQDALRKYRDYLDLASLYTYLAAKVYDYETTLGVSSSNSGAAFLSSIVKERTIGQFNGENPVSSGIGLANQLAAMQTQYNALKSQLNLNNPVSERFAFSLRDELFRLNNGDDEAWRSRLAGFIVEDIQNDSDFRNFAVPFTAAGPAQRALKIEIPTSIRSGENLFGNAIGIGENSYSSTAFSTRVQSATVLFTGLDNAPAIGQPRVYLFPAGTDIMRVSNAGGAFAGTREFTIRDQFIPLVKDLTGQQNSDAWVPFNDYDSNPDSPTTWADIRRFGLINAFNDPGGSSPELDSNPRTIGRSVWNTRWVLIIPESEILASGATLETLINGGDFQGTDFEGISDIRVYFKTYTSGL